MKRCRISDTISNLDEGIIREAAAFQKATAPKSGARKTWSAVAACLALLLAVSIPFTRSKLPQDDLIDSAWMIVYDNAYYEIIEDNPEALLKFGITAKEITADLAGKHLSYLAVSIPGNVRNDLVATNEETNMELLEYQPANNRTHRVFRNGDRYYIARFCNYLSPDDVSYPVNAALEVYGIYEAGAIKSIAPTSTDNTWEVTGRTVTDPQVIAAFYQELIRLQHYSEDEYHSLAFAGHLKEAEDHGSADAEIYTQYADDLRVLIIETVDGIRFAIRYYPTYKWLYLSATQTHCQMTPELVSWLENNIK